MSDPAASISAIAAVVSVGAAIWATKKSAKAQEASNRIQQQQLDIEGARERDRTAKKVKAELRISTERRDGERDQWSDSGGGIIASDVYRVKIANQGKAAARNVQVRFDGEVKHPCVRLLPDLSVLGPGAEAVCRLANHPDNPLPKSIELSWEDDSGFEGTFTTTLSF